MSSLKATRRFGLRTFCIAVGLLFLATPLYGMKEERLQLKWDELGPVVQGHKILTILNDGSEVQGRVTAVESQAIQVEISKPSNGYRRGLNSIPRSKISVLRMEVTSGSWRALGTAIGGGAGAAAGVPLYMVFENEGNSGSGAGFAAAFIGAGATVGYFLGREADRKALVIVIVD